MKFLQNFTYQVRQKIHEATIMAEWNGKTTVLLRYLEFTIFYFFPQKIGLGSFCIVDTRSLTRTFEKKSPDLNFT
ncbi:hypothetical protein BpHYR1_054222 [Brachionus plicatilis]|uniref:Uncharacterized protein n=1 Tax=Brachionus plicatilis TaxID=10195 RepID=A0A3M7PY41_BRAPC|nr:hypothetical protein BpHYR1_054222 [Brachionus plicatilis]